VGIEAGLNRSAIHARMSHAMPVSRNIHQGPASRASPARVLDPTSVRSSMAFMSSFLSGITLRNINFVNSETTEAFIAHLPMSG